MKLLWGEGEHVEVTWTEYDDDAAPVVIVWPAFGTPATFYRHLTPALRDAGVSALVVEYPGRDESEGIGRRTTYGYEELSRAVHPVLMAHVRERHPRSRIVVLGHSLGGQVVLLAAAAAQTSGDAAAVPDGVALIASASPYWRGYGPTGRVRSFVGTAVMSGLARAVGYWPGDRLKFWGRQSRVLVDDWARFARTGRIEPRGATLDYGGALAEYPGEVLAVSLPDDALAPVPALDNLLRLVPKAQVTRWHSPTRAGHIQWVRRNERIVPIISSWIRSLD